MTTILEFCAKNIGYIVSIVAGLTAIWQWVAKPLKSYTSRVDDNFRKLHEQNRRQNEKLDALDADTSDLLCSQLTREHDYFVSKGFCPSSDKKRISEIYNRYKKRGRNHLAQQFLDDICNLPNK